MRVVLFFSPTFLAWGKSITKYWALNNPEIEIIALASSRKVYNALQEDASLNFLVLECMEDLEREWINTSYDVGKLKQFEERIGAREVGNSVIVDRMLGHGFVFGAHRVDTELSRVCFNDDKIRAYITNMYSYYEGLFNKYKPDFAFLYIIAGSLTHGISIFMELNNKKFLYLDHMRIDNRWIVGEGRVGNFSPVWERYRSGSEASDKAKQWAKKWLNDYLDNQKLPAYMGYVKSQEKNLYSIKGYVKSLVKSFSRYVYFDILKSKQLLRSNSGVYELKNIAFAPLRRFKTLNRKFYLADDEIEDVEFIYFPLHVDPEASTMRIAPDHTNQLAVIEALAKRKPLSMNIIVKENPSMIGLRPKGFYQIISNMPGVKIAHPTTNSLSLIKRAALTATISGTVAWEALIEKKPVLVIGDSPYLQFEEGLVHCPALHCLDEGILKALRVDPLSDDKIIRFLSFVFDESFAVPSDLYWGQITDHVMDENIEYAHIMADEILRRYWDKDSSTITET